MAKPAPPKTRFLKRLQETLKIDGGKAGRTALDEGIFWKAHERASTRTRDTLEAAQRIAGAVAKQASAIEAVETKARGAASRSRELRSTFARVSDTFERLSLVALNAGLEAARLGESDGRGLFLVSEEVRTLGQRGLEGARELFSALSEVENDLGALAGQFQLPRAAAGEIAQHAAVCAGSASDCERALFEIEASLRKTTKSDPETAKAVAEAAEHARALLASLDVLRTKAPMGLVAGALRPLLEPLVRLVMDAPEDEDA